MPERPVIRRRRAAGQRRLVDVPVHRRDEDVLAVRRQHVIIVQIRDAVERDWHQRRCVHRHRPQTARAVDDQPRPVERPVRRLDEDLVRFQEKFASPARGVSDPQLGSLTVGQLTRTQPGSRQSQLDLDRTRRLDRAGSTRFSAAGHAQILPDQRGLRVRVSRCSVVRLMAIGKMRNADAYDARRDLLGW